MAPAGDSDELWVDEAGDDLDAEKPCGVGGGGEVGRRGGEAGGAEVGAVEVLQLQFFTLVVNVPLIFSDKFPAVRIESMVPQIQLSSEWCTFLLCSGKASLATGATTRCSLETVEARSCSPPTMLPCSALAAWRRGRRFVTAFRPGVGGDELTSISLSD